MSKLTPKACVLALICFLFYSCYKPAEACFSHSPSVIDIGDTVAFNAACSENTHIYQWNFGDGSADTILTGIPSITHVFTSSGSFTVTLKVKRKDGGSIRKGNPTETKIVTVQ